MFCILITGIPAAGKSTAAAYLSRALHLPVFSKDSIKELMFDRIGFRSRKEKVQLGLASMDILYYVAEQMMKQGLPFILENNFETVSFQPLMNLLEHYSCTAVTVSLTGDYRVIYERFLERDKSPERHRGHVVNDCYPEQGTEPPAPPISYEAFLAKIEQRGMDSFTANGPRIAVDTTDFSRVDWDGLVRQIRAYQAQEEEKARTP